MGFGQKNTYINFCILKGSKELYAHKLRSYDKYRYDVQNADSVFSWREKCGRCPWHQNDRRLLDKEQAHALAG